jgi:hypothetical protein
MNSPATRPLPNAADKAVLKKIAATVVQSCPSLQDVAYEVATNLLKEKGLPDLDPDEVYFHRFKLAESSDKTFTGWEHIEDIPYESLTLTQLVVHRFRATDQDNADLLDLYGGFYTAGPQAKAFNETNEVRLHSHEVLKAFWDINFSDYYLGRLTDFWHQHADDFRTLAKCNFLGSAIQALENKELGGDDFQCVVDAVAGPITWPVSLHMLQSPHPASDAVRTMDIAGHIAANLLRIVDATGRQILYLPGESKAFQIMEDDAALHWWVLEQMNDGISRTAFLSHFPLADRQQINHGLTELMNQLVTTWGRSDHHLINQHNTPVHADAFHWLQESTKNAMFAEASLSLTSNGDIRKKMWIGYLSAGLKVFGPLAAVGWPVALPVIGASIASMGLNIDQAVNGKTSAERKQGVIGAVLSGVDTLFNVPFLKGTGPLLEVGTEVEAAEAAEMADLLETAQAPDPASIPVAGEIEQPRVSVSEFPLQPIEVPTGLRAETAPAPEVPSTYICDEVLAMDPESEPGKYQGIYRLNGDPPYAILMQDNPYYVRYFADSQDGGYWAIVDPERPNQFVHSLPVRLNAKGQWERMRSLRLNGGGQCMGKECAVDIELVERQPVEPQPPVEPAVELPPSTSSRVRLVHTAFEATPSEELRVWAMRLFRTHSRLPPAQEGPRSLYDNHYANRFRALTHATYRFFGELPWSNLPPRPSLPPISREMSMTDLIDRLFAASPGVVVGETLDRISSMRFMIENMPAFARHAKTMYVRGLLSDFAQVELNDYFRTGNMSDDLAEYLIGLGTDPIERFNVLDLVKAARRNGVRIQALDCAARYCSPRAVRSRLDQLTGSYLAHEIMRTDRALNRTGKWIVLAGAQNTNTLRGFAGISELEGGIGLRIEEVNPGEETGVDIDPGTEVYTNPHPEDQTMAGTRDTVYADLRLRVEAPAVHWSEQEVHRLLRTQGLYLFERSADGYTLIHRSHSGLIVRTPVQRLAGGGFSIHRPAWTRINDIAFPSLEQLSQALDRMNLSLQSRIPA